MPKTVLVGILGGQTPKYGNRVVEKETVSLKW